MAILVGYLMIINFIAFLLMRFDKKRAVRRQYRIPEKTLWALSLAGGAAGSMVGMHLFRHKTKHYIFKIGLPLLVLIHLIVFYWLASVLHA